MSVYSFFVVLVTVLVLSCESELFTGSHQSEIAALAALDGAASQNTTYGLLTGDRVRLTMEVPAFKGSGSELTEEGRTCFCTAYILQSSPSQSLCAGYGWAVGIYHTLGNPPPTVAQCTMTQGPAGFLCIDNDSYAFEACPGTSVIFEFAVAPPNDPSFWEPVDVQVRLGCSTAPPINKFFSAEPGETILNEQQYGIITSKCGTVHGPATE